MQSFRCSLFRIVVLVAAFGTIAGCNDPSFFGEPDSGEPDAAIAGDAGVVDGGVSLDSDAGTPDGGPIDIDGGAEGDGGTATDGGPVEEDGGTFTDGGLADAGAWCAPGYELIDGVGCEDVNECATPERCGSAAVGTCENAAGSFACHCADGYQNIDGVLTNACTDIDECDADSACTANARCTNTVGSFLCSCDEGYDAFGDQCVLNPCLINNGGCGDPAVAGSCTNIGGVALCGCFDGYAFDGATCADVDECVIDHGGCDALTTCTNTTGGFVCGQCPHGYGGDGVAGCSDIDECEAGACGTLVECTNTDGSFECGDCPTGFWLEIVLSGGPAEEFVCSDIDECATDHGGCDPLAACTNTEGSFSCGACPAGYEGTGATGCIEIDECARTADLCGVATAGTCLNLQGSYECLCNAGYENESGGAINRCQDINECAGTVAPCDPNASCENSTGSFVCTCLSGYEGSGTTCSYNPCLVSNGGCGPTSAGTCQNNGGIAECHCQTGYVLDGGTCKDIDECVVSNGGCDSHVACTNTDGSFSCGACPSGFTGTGETECVDIDECVAPSFAGCLDELCVNTSGSFECQPCEEGYVSVDNVCERLKTCQTENGGCDPLTTCSDEPDTAHCGACPSGYSGTGETGCEDINECSANNGGCDPLTACTNSPGSFSCGACPSGYSGTGETGCIDINECAAGTASCIANSKCANTPGSYQCLCYGGTTLQNGTCTDVDECATGEDLCSDAATCSNNSGAYTCQCGSGYQDQKRSPSARTRAADGWDRDHGRLLVFGGYSGPSSSTVYGDFWSWDGVAWTEIAGTNPSARRDAASVFDNARHRFILFGGQDGAGNKLSDTWEWDGTSWSQKFPTHSPSARTRAATSWEESSGHVLLFGGNDGSNRNDLWSWDGTDWTQITTEASPPVFTTVTMAYDPLLQRTMLAGYSPTVGRSGTWAFKSGAWSQLDSTVISSGRLVYDLERQTMLAFNALTSFVTSYYVYEWTGTTWRRTSTSNVYLFPAIAFDPRRHVVVMFGGELSTVITSKVIEHDLASFSLRTSAEGIVCADINECDTNNGGCAAGTCVNTGGSHYCNACPSGYVGPDLSSCEDINECATNNGGCPAAQICTNTEGSFVCGCLSGNQDNGAGACEPCLSGFVSDGLTACTDVDECASASGLCGTRRECLNTPGSYVCACPSGATWTGSDCVTPNACGPDHGGCDPDGPCTSEEGTATCGCPEGQTACGTACVDLQSDLINCGACGNVCSVAAGANTSTQCQLGRCVDYLARADHGVAMRLTNTRLYWADRFMGLWSVPLNGGTPMIWGTGSAEDLVLDATHIYWTESAGRGLWKQPLAGGPPTKIASLARAVGAGYLAMNANGIYRADPLARTITTVGLNGGAITTLASDQNVRRLIADSNNLYWTNDTAGVVVRMPSSGGTPVTIATGQVNADRISVDATSVYWNSESGLMKAPIAGGATVTFGALPYGALAWAWDDISVYWAEKESFTAPAVILKAPLAGGAPVTLFQGQIGPFTQTGTAVLVPFGDSLYISASNFDYPGGGGAIMKITPK